MKNIVKITVILGIIISFCPAYPADASDCYNEEGFDRLCTEISYKAKRDEAFEKIIRMNNSG